MEQQLCLETLWQWDEKAIPHFRHRPDAEAGAARPGAPAGAAVTGPARFANRLDPGARPHVDVLTAAFPDVGGR
ncbi:hypothetical protein [Streptomyces sp. cmx-4-9]|uniref:hypothetical protein n=1 Tax=Streptomyces sp. cmx-4-9 TaxID=2790941 RepID=UPI0039808CF2